MDLRALCFDLIRQREDCFPDFQKVRLFTIRFGPACGII